ncbi:hypothetical protein ACPA9J_00245 [Pseudomonas aeruginosa]
MPMPPEGLFSRGSGAAALLSTGAEGLELKIRDKLEHLAELDRTSPPPTQKILSGMGSAELARLPRRRR